MGKVFFYNGLNIIEDNRLNKKTYHYTSPNGLFSIMQYKKLWFTDSQFMNDKSEFVYISKILTKALELQKEKHTNIKDFVEHILPSPYESFELDKHAKKMSRGLIFTTYRYYLFCTTLKADSHNMWSYYMKNGNYLGYNFRLSIKRLLNLLSAFPGVTITHGKVIYDQKEQIRQTKSKLAILNARYDEMLKKGGKYSDGYNEYDPEDILSNEYQESLFEFLNERCLFFKSHAFESEHEYRFVVKVAVDQDFENFPLKHRVGVNGVIIPFRELSFEPKQIIDQITLAPMMEKEIAKEGLVSLLGLSYKNELEIKFSDIDVRY